MFLVFKVIERELLEAVVKEFISRGLDKVYAEEIGEWKKYIREQEFTIRLDKQMKEEVDRFMKEIKLLTVPELKEFVIEGLDCLKK